MSVRARPHQRPYPPRRHNGDAAPDSSAIKTSSDPLRAQHKAALAHLSEMFTDWKEEDLLSLLVEVNGDVALAATRISEGHAEQWGNVSRKKDKKGPSTPTFQQREYSPTARGGFRGGRGGGRGSARTTRGNHRDGPAANGHGGHQRSESTPASFVDGHTTAAGQDTTTSDPQHATTDATWGESTAAENGDTTTTSAPLATTNGNADTQDHPTKPAPTITTSASAIAPHHTPASATKQPVKTPGTAKLSWAQIARPQDKPKPTPPPAPAPAPAAHLPPAQQQQQAPPPPPPAREPTPPPPEHTGWEAPTTVEPPTWDDEPTAPAVVQPDAWDHTQTVVAPDGWVNITPAPPSDPKHSTTAATEQPKAEMAPQPPVSETKPAEPRAPSPPPGLPTPSIMSVTPALSVAPTQPSTSSKPSTPRHSHRNAARYKTDQAVVMPGIHFGSTNTAFDKVGMQFGSLSIGSDLDTPGVTDQSTEPAPQETPVAAPVSEPAQLQPAQQQVQPTVPQPAAPSPSANQPLYQQQSPVHTQAPPSATAPALAPVPSPIQGFSHQQTQTPAAAHHPPQTQTHHQPQNPSLGGHSHHPSYSQHLPQQLDSSLPQQQQQHVSNQAAHGSQQAITSPTYTGPSSHFRQPEQNYYAGTPTSQGQQQQQQQQQYLPQQSLHQAQQQQHPQQQDNPYGGGAFTPLGQQAAHHGGPSPQNHLGGPVAQNHLPSPLGPPAQQQGHLSGPSPQGPGAHLSGFGTGGTGNAGEYGTYGGDVARGFYESYGPATGYGGRLGHEDAGKPISSASQAQTGNQGAQAQPATPSALGPQGAQAQHGQGQGQQQYPNMLPMGSVPYYYPYYNQYYGNPPGGYQPPFVKYPPMYGATPNPPGQQQSKPIASSGGTQSPYGSALHHGAYGGPGGTGYDDPSALYQQPPGNQGPNDYSKNQQQLYGGQGMQNYIGSQGAGTPQLSGGPQRVPTSAGGVVSSSPENYKPYNSGPDKSNGTTGASGRVGGQPQQGGVGAGGGSGYYPGRFGNAPQPPNQPGYPQQPTDGQYYPYQTQQPRHQGGYWQ